MSMTLHQEELLELEKRRKKRLVEVVFLTWCDFIPDSVMEMEWDKHLPMPPENTQIVLPGDDYFNCVARDKDTYNGYDLTENKSGELCWEKS